MGVGKMGVGKMAPIRWMFNVGELALQMIVKWVIRYFSTKELPKVSSQKH